MHFATPCFPKQIHHQHCADLYCSLLQSVYSVNCDRIFWLVVLKKGQVEFQCYHLFLNYFQLMDCNHHFQLYIRICHTSESTSVGVNRFTIQESYCCHIITTEFSSDGNMFDFVTAWDLHNRSFVAIMSSPKMFRTSRIS